MNCTKKVPGNNCEHHVLIYTLSTCGWCKKLKRLLASLDIEYDYVDVDLLSEEEKDRVLADVKKHNPNGSFPTMIIDGGEEVIVGFHEHRVREVLSK